MKVTPYKAPETGPVSPEWLERAKAIVEPIYYRICQSAVEHVIARELEKAYLKGRDMRMSPEQRLERIHRDWGETLRLLAEGDHEGSED